MPADDRLFLLVAAFGGTIIALAAWGFALPDWAELALAAAFIIGFAIFYVRVALPRRPPRVHGEIITAYSSKPSRSGQHLGV
jgi:uncharacterized membrane protein